MNTRVRRMLMAGFSTLLLGSGPRLAAQDQRTALLEAERATAKSSRDSGFTDAILSRIHRNGILLWPGAPVVAGASQLKRFLATLPIDSVELTWQPLGVELSTDSSLGITWGVSVASARRGTPAAELGSYIAAWQREGARWTIGAVVFAGLRRLPKPGDMSRIPASRPAIGARGGAGAFIAADVAFARLAADSGAAVAFERWASPEATTFGDRGLLTRGPRAIGRAVDFPAVWRWHPVAAGAAGSGDLGWTVGEATITPMDAAPTYSKYLTIWSRQTDGTVRFLTDGGNGRPATP
jgi:hypothetical protein